MGWTRGLATASSGSSPSSRIPERTVESAVRSRVAPAAPIASDKPVVVEGQAGRHPALEVVSRLGLAEGDVRLAEQVVELQVEAGNPDSGADPERVGEDAGAHLAVDGDHVGRVLAARRGLIERVDQREHSLCFGETGEAGEPG